MPNIFVGTGFKKWGMTFSNIAANIIAPIATIGALCYCFSSSDLFEL